MDEYDKQQVLETETYVESGLGWQFKRLFGLWLKIFLVIVVPLGIFCMFAGVPDGDDPDGVWIIPLVLGIFGATKICFWVGVFRLVTWLFSGGRGQGNVTVINEASPTDTATEIEKYHDLFEKGIISQEEFDQKKSELL